MRACGESFLSRIQLVKGPSQANGGVALMKLAAGAHELLLTIPPNTKRWNQPFIFMASLLFSICFYILMFLPFAMGPKLRYLST
jgi:hypothetical protein